MATVNMDSPQTKQQKTGLLINRNYGFLFVGQFISLIGDEMFDLTLILWIVTILAKGQTWAPLAVSGLLVAASVPILLVGPLAGVFADRWNRRKTMLRMDILRALLIASLLLISGVVPLPDSIAGFSFRSISIGIVYLVVFLESVCAQFFQPSRFALIGELVTEPQRPQATGLGQLSQAFAVIAGPPLAAPLLFGLGVQWALIANSLSFVVSFLAISAVRYSPNSETRSQQSNTRREFIQGIQFTFSNTVLRTLAFSEFLMMLGIGSFIALIVFFISHNLHVSSSLLGILLAFFGGGAIVGAIVFSVFMKRLGIERVYALSILLSGIVFVVFSRLTDFSLALGVVFFLGILQSALNIAASPLVLQAAPNDMVGRVAAILTPLNTLGTMIATALAGYLASTVLVNFHKQVLGISFGPLDTIFAGAGIILFITGILVSLSLRVRKE